jgi:hypothetical protein
MTRALALAGLVAAALAAAPPVGAQSFNRVDANRDGYVSFAEAKRFMSRLQGPWYNKCDQGRDDRLDLGEYNCLQGIYQVMESGS